MLIVMAAGATQYQVDEVCREVHSMGLTPHSVTGTSRTVINVTGNKTHVDSDHLLMLQGVEDVIQVTPPYKLASRDHHPNDSIIDIDGVKIGGQQFVVMAGPCAVESRDQCMIIAERVAQAGAKIFRGGAFKPRTSPYSFQGLGEQGLKILAEVREKFGMKIVTEAIDTDTVDLVAGYADMIQIGARNMQNFSLLKKAGKSRKPVLLKRGMAATLEEFLMAAEYILAEGNPNVVLCERGVRTIADHSRNVLDLAAIPQIKRISHLPIIADPSHGTGRRGRVLPLSRASIAVGADGLLIEVHGAPESALSDGPQAITPDDFALLMDDIRKLAPVVNRSCC